MCLVLCVYTLWFDCLPCVVSVCFVLFCKPKLVLCVCLLLCIYVLCCVCMSCAVLYALFCCVCLGFWCLLCVCLYAIFFVNWCACMSCDVIKCLVLCLHAPCCVCMTCDLFACPVLCQYALFFFFVWLMYAVCRIAFHVIEWLLMWMCFLAGNGE